MQDDDELYPQTGPGGTWRRISAMVLRYWYLNRSSWPRLLELIYWPLLQMLMWGFLQTYLAQTTSFYARSAGIFIGAVLLWDILVRAQLGFSISFLEEIWSRNLGHLLMSPLRPNEFVAALALTSLMRLVIAVGPVILIAYLMFGFNMLSLGFSFAAFFANLMLMAWALGLVSIGVVLRYGLGAESFAWMVPFALLPVCCVYYPVTTLPGWLQPVALSLSPTYVFEGLRALLLDGQVRVDLMLKAAALNVVALGIGYAVFAFFLRSARNHGTLMQMGE